MGRCGGKRYAVKPGPWNHRSTESIVRMTDQSNYKEKEKRNTPIEKSNEYKKRALQKKKFAARVCRLENSNCVTHVY